MEKKTTDVKGTCGKRSTDESQHLSNAESKKKRGSSTQIEGENLSLSNYAEQLGRKRTQGTRSSSSRTHSDIEKNISVPDRSRKDTDIQTNERNTNNDEKRQSNTDASTRLFPEDCTIENRKTLVALPLDSLSLDATDTIADVATYSLTNSMVLSKHDVSPVRRETAKEISNPLADAIASEDWSEVELQCENDPSLARQQVIIHVQGEKTPCLPLHFACFSSPHLTAVDALITAYPSSVLQAERRRGRLPLHIALVHRASLAVIECIAKTHRDCVKMHDRDGCLPLHIASLYSNNETIRFILLANPKGCQDPNNKGKLPLHILCARWTDNDNNNSSIDGLVPSIELIRDVMRTFPQAVETIDSRGRLPIHAACSMQNPRSDILDMLLQERNQTILSKDNMGNTPLALARKISLAVQDNNANNGIKVLEFYNSKLKGNLGTRIVKAFVSQFHNAPEAFAKRKHLSQLQRHRTIMIDDGSGDDDTDNDNEWIRCRFQRGTSPVTKKR